MIGINEEEWMRICLRAMTANDPDTLTQIILDINRMLYLKQQHLKHNLEVNERIAA
jgi:hypothetical protein